MHDPPPRIVAPGFGEVPPTAGLPPRWRDLFGGGDAATFEAALGDWLGISGNVEITSTGTAALLIAFTTLKERAAGRDVVIVPGYTCPLVPIAAAAAGLRCVACDTAPGTLDLDPAHLARLIDARTLAIVPTHLGGWLTDVAAVRRVANSIRPGIAIVEDAAQAMGAFRIDGPPATAGSGRYNAGLDGDIGVLSLGAGKGLTIYEGGALISRDADEMRRLRANARRLERAAPVGGIARAMALVGYHAVYNPLGLRVVFGRPKRKALARGDEIEAAGDRFPHAVPVTRVGAWRKRVGRAALVRLDAHLAESRARFDGIATRLQRIPGLHVHVPPPHMRASATSLLVTLRPHPERDSLIRALWTSRLGVTRMFAHAIGDYPDIAPLLLPSATPNARALAEGTFTISTSAYLSRAGEAVIVDTLEGFAASAGWSG